MENRYFGSYKINSDGTMDIKVSTTPISTETLAIYERFTGQLEPLKAIVDSYECASRNADALNRTISKLHHQIQFMHVSLTWVPRFIVNVRHIINQNVSNFVYSSRQFIEHTEGHLKREFGQQSNQYNLFKSYTHHLYDQHFSYRFMVALRNYTIHRNVPVSLVGLNSKRCAETNSLKLSFVYMVDRKLFIQEYGDAMKSSLRSELESLCDDIDILPIMAEQNDWNRQLFNQIISNEWPRIDELQQHYAILRQKLNFPKEEVPVVWVCAGERTPPKKYEAIPLYDLENIVHLLQRSGPSSAL